jgi:GNAT superfamily N-acetyltransferase
MTIRIQRRNDLSYNDFIMEIGQNPMLFNLTNASSTILHNRINNGERLPLQDYPEREVYGIEYVDELVGFLIVDPIQDPEYGQVWEISQLILEQYRCRGIGRRAFELLLSQNIERKWSCTVHRENIAIDGLERMVLGHGFKEVPTGTDAYKSWILNI